MSDKTSSTGEQFTKKPTPWLREQQISLSFTERWKKRFKRWLSDLKPYPKRVLYWMFLVPAYYVGYWIGAAVSAGANLWWTVRAGVVDGFKENSIERN